MTAKTQDYPDRPRLVGQLVGVLKAARRPIGQERAHLGLDHDGELVLNDLVWRLVLHVHFEHLDLAKLRSALREDVVRYRAMSPSDRPNAKEFAGECLDAIAREPMVRAVYLGVEHLRLPSGTVVGQGRFVRPVDEADLLEAFAWGGRSAPELVYEVEVSAGTDELIRERACRAAETALGLVRQQNLFGFMSKIYLDQVLYGLDGTWTWRDGSTVSRAGWWRARPSPIPMDLDHENSSEWRAKLDDLSDLYRAVAPELRLRVDTCIDWLDVAALNDRWRIIIPAIFSGMEALLVPESGGLKAAVVTVRSVAVHAALEKSFFNPGEIVEAYELRSELIHGDPASEVLDKNAKAFADNRRSWAFEVLRDYLQLAKEIEARRVRDIVAYLDEGKCNEICAWLGDHGGSVVVDEYRGVVPRSS